MRANPSASDYTGGKDHSLGCQAEKKKKVHRLSSRGEKIDGRTPAHWKAKKKREHLSQKKRAKGGN